MTGNRYTYGYLCSAHFLETFTKCKKPDCRICSNGDCICPWWEKGERCGKINTHFSKLFLGAFKPNTLFNKYKKIFSSFQEVQIGESWGITADSGICQAKKQENFIKKWCLSNKHRRSLWGILSWKKKIKIIFSFHTFPTCCKYRITNGIWEAILFYCSRIRWFKPSTHSFICPNAHPAIWFYLCSFNWIISSISTSSTMLLFLKQTVPSIW